MTAKERAGLTALSNAVYERMGFIIDAATRALASGCATDEEIKALRDRLERIRGFAQTVRGQLLVLASRGLA
jgi:hypothetical protein